MPHGDFPVHWRPEGWQLLACGAPHLGPHDSWYHNCCRANITEVTCTPCLRKFGQAMSPSGSEMFPGPAVAAGPGQAQSTSAAAAAGSSEQSPSGGAPGITAADIDAGCPEHLPGDWSAHTRAEWNARTEQLRAAGWQLEALARDRWAADPGNFFKGDLELRLGGRAPGLYLDGERIQ